MNDTAGEAVFIIKLDTKQAETGLQTWQQKLDSSMAEGESSTRSLASGFDDLASSIASLATAGLALNSLTGGISSVTEAYNQYQAAMNGVKAVARATGNDVAESMQSIRDVTAGGLITQEDAAAAMKNLQRYGYSVQEATQMIKVMTDAAVYDRQANYSVSESVRVTTEGIRMENSVLSDASGVMKNIAKMHEEYAAQLGISTAQLTDAQKAQAVYNGYMQEGGIFAGNAEQYTQTLAGSQQQLSTALTQVKQVLGAMFNSFAPIISGFANWISENQQLVAVIVTTVGILIGGAGLVAAIRVAVKAINTISSAMATMSLVSFAAKGVILGLVTTVAAIGAAFLVSSGIDSMNDSMEDATASSKTLGSYIGNVSSEFSKLEAQAKNTSSRIDDLTEKLNKLDRDYKRDLKKIAVSHQENLDKLTQQIEEANVDYRRAIDERIADFNVSLAKEERTHQEMVDELMTQLNFLQRYNNDYNRQKLAQVQFALAKEQALYEKQTQAEREQLELQNEQDRLKNEQKLASLQKELDDERAFMDKHRDALNSVRDVILLDEIESLNERFAEQKRSYQDQIAEARTSGNQIGSTLGSGISQALQDQMNQINLTGQGIDIGKGIMNGIGEGLKAAANGVWEWLKQGGILKNISDWVGGLFSGSSSRKSSGSGGWAEGGYTGRGNPNDVAGVVHKGEYVIPADQVNQNTGLPKVGNTTVQNFSFNLSGVLATSAQAKRELAAELQRAIQQTNQARLS